MTSCDYEHLEAKILDRLLENILRQDSIRIVGQKVPEPNKQVNTLRQTQQLLRRDTPDHPAVWSRCPSQEAWQPRRARNSQELKLKPHHSRHFGACYE